MTAVSTLWRLVPASLLVWMAACGIASAESGRHPLDLPWQSAGASQAFPVFLRPERTGNAINGRVIDGAQMTLGGSVQADLPSDALIGLAVTSHERGTLATATFDGTLRDDKSVASRRVDRRGAARSLCRSRPRIA